MKIVAQIVRHWKQYQRQRFVEAPQEILREEGEESHCLEYQWKGVVEAQQRIPGGERKGKNRDGVVCFVLVVDCKYQVILVVIDCVG